METMSETSSGVNPWTLSEKNTADDKLTGDDWVSCEIRPSDRELKVMRALINIDPSAPKAEIKTNLLRCIGEEQYSMIPMIIQKLKVKHEKEGSKKLIQLIENVIGMLFSENEQTQKISGKKKGQKKGKVSSKSGDEIRLANMMSGISTDIEKIFITFFESLEKKKKFNMNFLIFTSSFGSIEMQGIGFLMATYHVMHLSPELYESGVKYGDVLELIAGMQKYINRLSPEKSNITVSKTHVSRKQQLADGEERLIKGINTMKPTEQIAVSLTFVNQIKSALNLLRSRFKVNAIDMFNERPHLVLFTDWDNMVPGLDIKPNESQKKFFECLEPHLKINANPTCIFYNTSIGGGKTTSFCMFSRFTYMMRQNGNQSMQALFCCNVDDVRYSAANSSIFTGSPCVIANITHDIIKEEIIYVLHNGKCMRAPKKLERLTKKSKPTGKFTFVDDLDAIDESTILSTFTVQYPSGKKVKNVMWTAHNSCRSDELPLNIIAGPEATLLMLQLNVLNVNVFVDEHTLNADKSDSEVMKFNAKIMNILPKLSVFASATSPSIDQLENFKNHYNEKYSNGKIIELNGTEFSISLSMKNKYDGSSIFLFNGCKTVAEIEKLIQNTSESPLFCRMYTHDMAIYLFDKMKANKIENLPDVDKIFSSITSLNPANARKFVIKLLKILAAQCDDKIVEIICSGINIDDNYKVDIKNIMTVDAHKLVGQTLAIDPDPTTYVFKIFEPIKAQLIEDGFIYKHIEDKIIKEIQAHNAKCEALEKTEKKTSKSKNDNDSNNIDTEQKLRELSENTPTASLPNQYILNSPEHFKLFVKDGTYIAPKIQTILKIEDLVKLDCSDDLKILLHMRIGINNPHDKRLTDTYRGMVTKLMKEGYFVVVFSDKSICTGANYPFTNIFIDSVFAEHHSVNTLVQALGRAGRRNLAYSAIAYIDNGVMNKIVKHVTTQEFNNTVEAENMNNMFMEADIEMKQEKKDEQEFLLEKYKKNIEKKEVKDAKLKNITEDVIVRTKKVNNVCDDDKLIQINWEFEKKTTPHDNHKVGSSKPAELRNNYQAANHRTTSSKPAELRNNYQAVNYQAVNYQAANHQTASFKSADPHDGDSWRRQSTNSKPIESVDNGSWCRKSTQPDATSQQNNKSTSYVPPHMKR